MNSLETHVYEPNWRVYPITPIDNTIKSIK
jgi:hypothetical protein